MFQEILSKKMPNLGLVPSHMRNWLQQRIDIFSGECLPSTESQRNVQKERKNIEAYFGWTRDQFPDYMRALEKITQKKQSIQTEPGFAGIHEIGRRSLEPMNTLCRTSIVIPARKEEGIICHSLSEIVKQVDEQGQPLDPNIYEITILVNVAEHEQHDNTFNEVMNFKRTYPQMHINVIEVKIQKPWANIGFIRKLANDLTLLRAISRGGNYQEPLYIDMEDADLLEVDPLQVETNIRLLDSNPVLDAAVGYSDMMPSETIYNDFVYLNRSVDHLLRTHTKDLIHQIAPEKRNFDSTRLWTYGVNTVVNAGSFALCGGYDWRPEVGEDLDLGKRISAMRGQVDKNGVFVPNIATIGFSGTTISSSPRRYFWELVKNLNGYNGGNFRNQEVRAIPLSELKAKAPYKRIAPENIQRFQRTFYFAYEQLRFILPDKQLAHKVMSQIMLDLGFKLDDFTITDRRVILQNVSNIAKELENRRQLMKSNPPRNKDEQSQLEQLYRHDINNRREFSQTLLKNRLPIRKILETFGNDYSALESYYREVTGTELVTDPIGSLDKNVPIYKTCSVIMSAYNNYNSLINTLLSLSLSSFARKYPDQFEVVVVDDGSTNGDINQVIKTIGGINMNIRIVKQKNGGQVGALYTAAQLAKGEIVVNVDADYMPLPLTIEEFMKRHEVLDNIALIGFRSERDPSLISTSKIRDFLSASEPNFYEDVRFIGDNNYYQTNWFKDSGNNNIVYDGHSTMKMTSFCHGVCRSMPKQVFLNAMAGYTPGVDFNPGDEILTQRVIAQGLYVIPCFSALGFHLTHPSTYNPKRSQMRRMLMRDLAEKPFPTPAINPFMEQATKVYEAKYNNDVPIPEIRSRKMRNADISLIYYQAGLYEKAVEYVHKALEIDGTSPRLIALASLLAIKNNNLKTAQLFIERGKKLKINNGWLDYAESVYMIKLGLYQEAKNYLQRALQSGVDLVCQYAKSYFKPNGIREAKKYLEEAQNEPKKIESAITCLEAALVQDPNNQEAKRILEQVNGTT